MGGQIPLVSIYQRGRRPVAQQALGFRLEEFWLKQPGMTGKKLSRVLYLQTGHRMPGPGFGFWWRRHLTRSGTSSVRSCHWLFDGFSADAPRWNPPRPCRARSRSVKLIARGYRRDWPLHLARLPMLRLDHSWFEAMAYHQLNIPKKNWVRPLIQTDFSEKKTLRWIREERPDSILTHYGWIRGNIDERWLGTRPGRRGCRPFRR